MRIKKNAAVQNVGGENVILCQGVHGVDTTKIVALNSTAFWLWNRFVDEENFTLAHVAGALRDEFDLECAKAAKDAQVWVEGMIKNDLIER